MNCIKAVILAGGLGTRLYPLTRKTPKCMHLVNGKPLLEHIIKYLAGYNFRDIIVTLGKKHEQVSTYFGDGSRYNVSLQYSIERKTLGTAGSFKNAEKFLHGNTLVVQGDTLTNFDLEKIVGFHNKRRSLATIALTRVKDPTGYGVAVIDKEGRITRFKEKPEKEFFSNLVNSGIYVLAQEILNHIPRNMMFDFSKNLFPELLKKKLPLYGIKVDGYWFDIGTPESYKNANEYLQKRQRN